MEETLRQITFDEVDIQRAKRMTFNELANEWLEVYDATGKKKSSIRVRQKEINVLNRYMAKQPLSDINYRFYQSVINNIAKDYARNTSLGINNCANMIFKYAVKANLLKDNPARDIVVPKKAKKVEEIKQDNISEKFLTTEELDEFLDTVDAAGLELDKEIFYTLAFSGMRTGELLALKMSDLDFEERTIDISKNMYNENNNMRDYELTPPKTEGSIRLIDMEPEIMDLLQNLVHENKKNRFKYRYWYDDYHDEDFLFCHKNGYPQVPRFSGSRMKRLIQLTGIQKKRRLTFSDTHISVCLQKLKLI